MSDGNFANKTKMHKRIAVNSLSVDAHPTGGRTYLFNLMEEMTKVCGNDYEFHLLVSECVADMFLERIKANNTKMVVFPSLVTKPPIRICIEQVLLPIWLRSRQIDLLFAARNVMPILAPCPTVIGILSMHLNYEQKSLPWWRRVYGPLILRLSAKRADAYVAISEYAGRTYVEKYRLPLKRLFVAPCGFTHRVTGYNARNSNPMGSEYLLFVSTLSPHKNVPFLIRVFAEIVKVRPTVKLVIVGRGERATLIALRKLAKELSVIHRIHFTGAIADNELMQLYRHARVFVFPSLIEGFGLPPLEAMAHSVPVVVSNKTSIPEVVGDAGIVLSPDDERPWVEAILRILEDPHLHQAISMRARNRAKIFTWRRAAEVTLDSFETVLGDKTE